MVTKPNINLEFLLKPRTLAFTGLILAMLPNLSFGNVHIQKAQPTAMQRLNAPVEEGYRLIGIAKGNVSEEENRECLDEACKIFNDTLKIDSLNYKALRGNGIIDLIRGNLSEAVSQLEEARERTGDDAGLLLDLSDAYRRSRNFKEAEKYAKKVLKLDPDSCLAINKLGLIAFDKEKYDEAIKHYDAALKCDEEFISAWANKALAQLKKKDLEGARKSIDKALDLDSADAYAWVVNGLVYEGEGKCEQAKVSVETAVSLKPYAQTFKDILDNIDCNH